VRAKEIVSKRVRENEKRVYLGFQEKEIERRVKGRSRRKRENEGETVEQKKEKKIGWKEGE
jgi:hypothetical protein